MDRDLIAEWLLTLEDAGVARWTRRTYRLAARRLLRWAQAHPDGLAACAQEAALRGYLRQWGNTGTRGTQLNIMRGFVRWLHQEGLIPADGAAGISRPRRTRRAPRVLTEDEDRRLQEVVRRESVEVQAFVALLRDSGRRVGEIAGHRTADGDLPGLRIEHVDVARKLALVLGKGRKVVPVYLHDETAALLRLHLAALRRAGRGAGDAPVFQARTGQVRGVRWARQLLRRLAARAGIGRQITPHMLRHTFATRFIEHGGDIRALQRILGHAHIDTTLTYADYVADGALRRQFDEHARRWRERVWPRTNGQRPPGFGDPRQPPSPLEDPDWDEDWPGEQAADA